MSKLAIEELRKHQQQLDHEGIMVGVSRQALDETLTYLSQLQAENERFIQANNELGALIAGLQAENERLRQSTAEADKILADGIVELQTELANAHEMNWQLRKMVLKVDHPETVRRMRKIETKYRRVGQPHETTRGRRLD